MSAVIAPYKVVLKPGDVIGIPPGWVHEAGVTTSQSSLGFNTWGQRGGVIAAWRSLSELSEPPLPPSAPISYVVLALTEMLATVLAEWGLALAVRFSSGGEGGGHGSKREPPKHPVPLPR